jgi:hypothetical protein
LLHVSAKSNHNQADISVHGNDCWWWLHVTETCSKLYIIEHIVVLWLNDTLVITATQRGWLLKIQTKTFSFLKADLHELVLYTIFLNSVIFVSLIYNISLKIKEIAIQEFVFYKFMLVCTYSTSLLYPKIKPFYATCDKRLYCTITIKLFVSYAIRLLTLPSLV